MLCDRLYIFTFFMLLITDNSPKYDLVHVIGRYGIGGTRRLVAYDIKKEKDPNEQTLHMVMAIRAHVAHQNVSHVAQQNISDSFRSMSVTPRPQKGPEKGRKFCETGNEEMEERAVKKAKH